jgi:ATP-dependent helicase/nuclease subunit A
MESLMSSPSPGVDWIQEFGGRDSLVVRAGAGAGKTTELVQRVLAIAKKFRQEKGRFPRMVVTTFTRKATQELRERLMQKALSLKDQELADYVQKQSLLHVSTIHGVLSIFLSHYGSHMGLNPRFSFIDEGQESRIFKKAIREVLNDPESVPALEDLLAQTSLAKLISAFKAYVEHRVEQDGPLQAADWNDFTQAVSTQDEKWIVKAEHLLQYLSDNETSEGWKNYHQLLQEAISLVKKRGDFRVQGFQLFEQRESPRFKKGTDEEISLLRKEIQNYSKEMHEEWIHSKAAWDLHAKVSADFVQVGENIFSQILNRKLKSAMMAMQDLEIFSLRLLRLFPKTGKNFASEWDYWFIDEYQDTSPRQVFLLQHLVDDKPSFVVGDPQQSIYLFRGARSEVFTDKEKLNRTQGGQSLEKMQNYRSRPELLKFFNHFFLRLSSQFKAMIPSENKSRVDLQNEPAAVFIHTLPPPEEKALRISENPMMDENANFEHQAVIHRCLELLKQGVAPEQICVLSRTNAELDRLAILAAQYSIPVQVHASAKFFSRREVQDALTLLKFLLNPSDNLNLLELLRSPWFYVQDTLLLSCGLSYNENFWFKIRKQLEGEEGIARLINLENQIAERGAGQVWVDGVLESGLLLSAQMMDPSGRREANLWKLIHLLKSEERKPGFNYIQFSERAEAQAQEIEAGSDGDATPVEEPKRVNLMTIHASKGLQFDYVILPSFGKIRLRLTSRYFTFDEEKRKFTLSLASPETGEVSQNLVAVDVAKKIKERELKEYDRLLYVALTRAKLGVTLVWSEVKKDSWAERAWRPELGLQKSEGFSTLYLDSPEINLEPWSQTAVKRGDILLPWKSAKEIPAKAVHSVTSILEVESGVATEPLQKEMAGKRVQKAILGVETHRLFESLKFRGIDDLLVSAKTAPAVNFLKTWKDGSILKWIQAGEVEWGFSIALADQWIQGQIDLWSMDADGTPVVVDYKTGSSVYAEKAFEQLEIYAWALQKMKKIPMDRKVKLVVIYPFDQDVQVKESKGAELTEKRLLAAMQAAAILQLETLA